MSLGATSAGELTRPGQGRTFSIGNLCNRADLRISKGLSETGRSGRLQGFAKDRSGRGSGLLGRNSGKRTHAHFLL